MIERRDNHLEGLTRHLLAALSLGVINQPLISGAQSTIDANLSSNQKADHELQ